MRPTFSGEGKIVTGMLDLRRGTFEQIGSSSYRKFKAVREGMTVYSKIALLGHYQSLGLPPVAYHG
jgi:hypothetical protein